MRRKSILVLAIALMSIGFAAVSTTLLLNGTIGIETNNDDFDVYFSKAVENGVENNSLIQDKTHISFRTELSKINEKYVLEYDVTNGSKQYDANVTMNCIGGNEFLRIDNLFNMADPLKAREVRNGKLTLTVIKSVLEDVEVTITCEITGNAVEREEVGGEGLESEQLNLLTYSGNSSTEFLKHPLDKSKVESIFIKDNNIIPDNVIDSWDASMNGNGSIMAYTIDEDNNGLYELYIGQNGGVIPFFGGSLFSKFNNVTLITGFENLKLRQSSYIAEMFSGCSSLVNLDLSKFDTRNATNMSKMFYNCRSLSNLKLGEFNTGKVTSMQGMFEECESLTELDLESFDTSKVTNMSNMFYNCIKLTNLDVSSFNTENVTNMQSMFFYCSELQTLDVSGFNTAKVTSMYNLFVGCSSLVSLDVSHFDTSNVTDTVNMFSGCSSLIILDVSSFDTSNVTSMASMFRNCSQLMNLDLSGFDTSKVTDMARMFNNCYKLSTTITIRGTNCTKIEDDHEVGMFEKAATEKEAKIIVNYTEDASELVDKMIATKSTTSNVIKGSIV